jgi:alpha-L-fucosidase
VLVREAVALGQRVEEWALEAEVDGEWRTLARATTMGIRRILRFPPVNAARVRVVIVRARACPAIAQVRLFLSAPVR